MKVVVLDHPKFLSFFLRKIYGIKKIKDKENA
ncbi:MAG: stage V sporulation protein SpoVM [Ruminococcus sp.]|nr:stage V sporulation protein SpoVM [Ruminococcus sp.]MBQ9514741.1 stage V sporulation protein SpoVM [Ruminococcus sp.]